MLGYLNSLSYIRGTVYRSWHEDLRGNEIGESSQSVDKDLEGGARGRL